MSRLQKCVALCALLLGVIAYMPGDTAAAATIPGTPTVQPSTARATCTTGLRVDFSIAISNVTLNTTTGRAGYDVTVRYRRCPNSGETRGYAIYNSNGNFCKLSGYYGGDGTGHDTYDCVKYVGNPAYQGGSGLSCDNRNPHQLTDDECVVKTFANSGVIKQNQPNGSINCATGDQCFTRRFTQVISNWDNGNNNGRKYSSGSARVGGGRICQYFKYGANWSQESTTAAQRHCVDANVTVRWIATPSWNITPRISKATADTEANKEVGDVIRWNHWITNSGETTTRAVRYGNNNPAGPWQQPAGLRAGDSSITRQSSYTIQPGDVGRTICRRTYANPGGAATGQEASASVCYVIPVPRIKRPTIHVTGGDVRVHNGEIITSTSKYGRTYGSWGEYGAVSSGKNETFSSGAGLLHGHTNDYTAPSPWSKLTFANVGSDGITNLGNYALGSQTGNARQFFRELDATSVSSNNYTLSASDGRRVLDFGNRNITLSGAANITGEFIIRTTGTVTITSDILLNTSLSLARPADIPQVVIVARGIVIEPSVENIDAWLLADDTITTCRVAAPPITGNGLSSNDCNRPLRVNGPVQARKIHLYRTFGSGIAAPETAAETFNLPAYIYLWAYQQTIDSARVTTMYTTEQPPRF